MKPHKHAEAIKAWADGKPVEYRYPSWAKGRWEDIAIFPAWDERAEYRPKSEIKTHIRYCAMTETDQGGFVVHSGVIDLCYAHKPISNPENHSIVGYLRLEVDAKTKEIISCGVIHHES